MRPALTALLALLLMEGLLLGLGAAYPSLDIAWPLGSAADSAAADTARLRYLSLDQMFDLAPPATEHTDSLLDRLLAGANGESSAPLPIDYTYADTGQHPLFINPEQPDGTHALDKFFASLYDLEKSTVDTVVRIEHFGDSQIEGDRITHFIRTEMQNRFGGNGFGIVPFNDIASHHAITRQQSGYWRRHNIFSDPYRAGRYNVGGLVYKYGVGYGPDGSGGGGNRPRRDSTATPGGESAPTPGDPATPETPAPPPTEAPAETGSRTGRATNPRWDEDLDYPVLVAGPPPQQPDSARPARRDTTRGTTAGGAMATAGVTFRIHTNRFDRARLLLGHIPKPCALRVTAGESVVFTDTLAPSTAGPSILNLPVPPGTALVRLDFTSPESPEVFGLMLDPRRGVQVDNFGLRGHAGDGIMRMNIQNLAQQCSLLNTRLIILQFGGNAVPSTHVLDWTFFEDAVYNQIMRLKRAAPNASILIVGVGDAAGRTATGMHTYHTVPRIRDAQLAAARRAGVAYWDLFQAMGGDDAIVAWVQRGLAAQDYAHFSEAGQRLVAKMMVQILLQEYDKYKMARQSMIGIQ